MDGLLGYSDAMSEKRAHILVVGGDSRIAAALAPHLGAAAVYVVRRPAVRSQDISVADYDNIPTDVFHGIRCIINCVGISSGSAVQLERVNVGMPRWLATIAKTAGVERLIHLSSFSVYGHARVIDQNTSVDPAGKYGQTKLAADASLLLLADDRFTVTLLRLPLVYGRGPAGGLDGKLGKLLHLWRRIKVLPVPAGDVSRAMISVELSAEVIVRMIDTPCASIVFAADPQPFAYEDAARALGGRLLCLPVPLMLTRGIKRAVPAIGNRLFANSCLADTDNLAIEYGLASRLYNDIAATPFQ